jgi:hypothetical protein
MIFIFTISKWIKANLQTGYNDSKYGDLAVIFEKWDQEEHIK